ncbi:uncharacterized protein LTR77_000207 [Saxophila tyrrhenica]|uniref:AAA+ ATPase domain-containing protein n=1 Tax=Saxophila tyrrhenica TaxID=1690608 RepID=A0AAV9PRV2_9PEZI|nr:hypothetical protein LTR77_000207 [Saxophila tyrrhenica]
MTSNRVDRQYRSFHITSRKRNNDPRSPNNSNHHTPVNGWHNTQAESRRHDEGTELEGGEHGEIKNGAFPRPGNSTRRTLRQRRMNDVPKPPPIPEWFLKHNVRLIEERREDKESFWEEYKIIRCVDTETGHTLFTLDYYEPLYTEKSVEKLQKRLESRKNKAGVPPTTEDASEGGTSELGQHFFDQKYSTEGTAGSHASSQEHGEQPFIPPSKNHPDPLLRRMISVRDWDSDPMRYPFLEAEMTVRAALSLPSEHQPSSMFATDRVDLSLQCPDPNSHGQMEEFVHELARVVGADLVRLDANDLAELSDEYVGQGDDAPGSFSNLGYEVFDGFEAGGGAQRLNAFRTPPGPDEANEMDEEEEAEEDDHHSGAGGGFGSMGDLAKALQSGGLGKVLGGRIVGIGIGGSQFGQQAAGDPRQSKSASATNGSEANRDDARLTALFDSLLNATAEKRAASAKCSSDESTTHNRAAPKSESTSWQKALKSLREADRWQRHNTSLLLAHLDPVLKRDDPTQIPFQLTQQPSGGSAGTASVAKDSLRKTIIHVPDLRDICDSKLGENIITRLSKVVRKRRRSGERIMIVGTTAQDVPGPFTFAGDRHEDFPFRTMTVPPGLEWLDAESGGQLVGRRPRLPEKDLDNPTRARILDINLRHIQSMLRRMRPGYDVDMCSAAARKQLNLPGMHFLTERVLTLDQVQRLALAAVGLQHSYVKAEGVQPVHVALAAFITTRTDHVQHCWSLNKEKMRADKIKTDSSGGEKSQGKLDGERGQARIDRIKKSLNQHENRLLNGVVDAEKIKTGFGDVHAVPETIDALKTATSLSLLRPDAFKYGVLANDRLPGLLLYGPPGTGKTLLAKAVAKESKATVLEVSGAQIYEKYVGEGEKMVRAVFSLAKKLSPCVVFIDEADAIFGSRSNAGNRNTHREIINQFLREWDGMDDHGCFMMVATNRPFDLDDAVLRRLPRRLLVDLPVAKDRESILGIHLRNEALDSSVSLAKLAEQTPYYSGSDLKNLSVAAALACVREENELADIRKDDTEFQFAEKRTLTSKHFEKALSEISASISEDMKSLTAIRKFDEQYGDRKGRRKKVGYGFSATDGEVDESAVRVRQDAASSSTSSPPP